MKPICAVTAEDVRDYVEQNIGEFHQKRVERLESLRLHSLLRRKNPYLFRAKAIQTVHDLIQPMLDAHLSSQEETMFGAFLEGLAVEVCRIARQGRPSGIEGIDLEFDTEDRRYIVSLKSGPNWGNSSQVKQMRDNFRRASRILRQNNSRLSVQPINGCCYGRTTRKFDRGDYWKLSGQAFWELISGDSAFYTRIVEPLSHGARERNSSFSRAHGRVVNRLEAEFISEFSTGDYGIDWDKLVAFNSKAER